MVLSKLFRKWFSKFEPQTVPFGEFGEVTSSRGFLSDAIMWELSPRLSIDGRKAGVFLLLSKDEQPSESHIHLCRCILDNWPTTWRSIQAVLCDLYLDDGPNADKQSYLEKMKPAVFKLEGDSIEWELFCKPDLWGHSLTACINDYDCTTVRLEG
ncbi:hypothetical protein OT109_08575 [Phycisphaeraceae bacterium D3-23]